MFVLLWLGIGYLSFSLARSTRRNWRQIRHHHAIPCTRCRYFSGEMVLKCPVNPKAALTDQAVDCPDFMGRVD
ncbi:hypothetical protein [Gloeobacter kilaueensis]|uniref:hypothetical protein n=1 Tax=Gloeobacter kilaueensis TaxID=1416614 RepID=UPI00059E615D|nr:hypothetical protein [Gloeobacter kilaueensis]